MPALINLVGQKFGRLLVLERAANRGQKPAWLCECDCGATHTATANSLRRGDTKSCGCLRRDLLTTHSLSRAPEYGAWIAMKSRCVNSGNSAYHNYGGRGIVVCERWLHNFQVFYDDMGPRLSPKHTLERVDNNAGYNPSNCKWATMREQNRNHRRNRLLTHSGRTQCLTAWAEELGIKRGVLWDRLDRLGWSVAKTLTQVAGVQ